MITASTWVPRGGPAAVPRKYQFDEDELDRISQLAKLQLSNAQEALDAVQKGSNEDYQAEDSDMEVDATSSNPRSRE